jgi:Zn-finger nucleic acid-binding protein
MLDSADEAQSGQKTHGCPRCDARLMPRHYGDLDVDECDVCGGLFLGAPAFDRIVQARDASTGICLALPKHDRKPESVVHYIHCPICSTIMNRQAFGRISGIIVDVCRGHGVWFDSGELADVLAFVERGGLEKARLREMEELLQRAKRGLAERAEMPTLPHAGLIDPSPNSVRVLSEFASQFLSGLLELWR